METLTSQIEDLKYQLAYSLAAIKIKDEELEKIRGHIGLYNLFSCVGSDSYDPECADLNVGKCREIAIEALTIQPDDAALKAWLGEPVVIGADHKLMSNWRVLADDGLLYAKPKGLK